MKIKPLNEVNYKIIYKVLAVFYYIIMAVAAIMILGFVVVLFIPKDILEITGTALNHIDFNLGDILIYRIRDIQVDVLSLKEIILTVCAVAFFILLLLVRILKQLKDIFITLMEKNPFDEKNATRIFKIGTLLIVGSFLINGGIALVYHMIIRQLAIQDLSVEYSINDGLFVSGILVMLLSSIFRYGSFLQNEYDQTV